MEERIVKGNYICAGCSKSIWPLENGYRNPLMEKGIEKIYFHIDNDPERGIRSMEESALFLGKCEQEYVKTHSEWDIKVNTSRLIPIIKIEEEIEQLILKKAYKIIEIIIESIKNP